MTDPPTSRPPEQTGADEQPIVPDDRLDELAEHLKALGAESETERRVKRIVPWVSSLLLHIGLILLGLLAVTAVNLMGPDEEPITVVAEFDRLNYEPVRLLNPNQAEVDQKPLQNIERSETVQDMLEERLRELDLDPLMLISDAATPSELAEFAPQPKQGTAKFAGLTGTNARRIVFVVDASGSMITFFHIVIEELSRSIEGLSAEQRFGIVFFQKGDAVAVPPEDRLIQATAQEKVRSLQWISEQVIPTGRSNPIKAVEKALSFEPDVIFLLSHNITGSGQFEIDQAELLSLLDDLNPMDPETGRRRTQIQCVQFLDHDPLDTLRKIALEHSGPHGYRFYDRRELGIGGRGE